MAQRLLWSPITMLLVLPALVSLAVAAAPPGPDELTENSAALWGAAAQSASASVSDDAGQVRVGSGSLRFDTDGGFDTWMWSPVTKDAGWDLLAAESGGVGFWAWAENPNIGFQNGSPWIRLCTTESDYIELHATSDILNSARGRWVFLNVPLTGDASWSVSNVGQPDLSSINWIEIHADTWDFGFSLWIDGLTFDAEPAPPTPPPYSVTPILFIPDPASFPAGYQPAQAELDEDAAQITHAMARVRDWYGSALGLGTSLNIRPVVVMPAWGGLADYDIEWTNPDHRYTDGIVLGDTWGKVLSEVSLRGFSPGDETDPHMVVIFCKGAGGFAGGAQWFGSAGGGMCMLGDFALDSFSERVPPEWVTWWTGVDRQTGATAHEMGHTLGLPHPDIANPDSGQEDWEYTVMGAWWNWPDFATNPADPLWPLHGLHGWGNNSGVSTVPGYNDVFLLDNRAAWFAHCLADLNNDGVIDLSDIAAFIDSFMNVDPSADLNGDGAFDLADIGLFVGAFTSPCS